jgi:hypothetical protein
LPLSNPIPINWSFVPRTIQKRQKIIAAGIFCTGLEKTFGIKRGQFLRHRHIDELVEAGAFSQREFSAAVLSDGCKRSK